MARKTKFDFYVNRIGFMYSGNVGCPCPSDPSRYVLAVAEPYAMNLLERFRAAWRVVRGDLHAIEWPKPGDLEGAIGGARWSEKRAAELKPRA